MVNQSHLVPIREIGNKLIMLGMICYHRSPHEGMRMGNVTQKRVKMSFRIGVTYSPSSDCPPLVDTFPPDIPTSLPQGSPWDFGKGAAGGGGMDLIG